MRIASFIFLTALLSACSSTWWVDIPPPKEPEVRKVLIDPEGNVSEEKKGFIIRTFAGTGVPGFEGDGGQAQNAQLNQPHGLVFDKNGNLYVADTGNHRIRVITSDGIISTIAGRDIPKSETDANEFDSRFFTQDGYPALEVPLLRPEQIALDDTGNLYTADAGLGLVRKTEVNTGITTIIAGGGEGVNPNNQGAATNFSLSQPQGLVWEPQNGLYISNTARNHLLRVQDGVLFPVAGFYTGKNTGGFDENETTATKTHLNNPTAITLDKSGNIYFSDALNHMVRMIDKNGKISIVVGVVGDATNPPIVLPHGLAFDSAGNLYIVDRGLNTVFVFDTQKQLQIFAGQRGAGNSFVGEGIESTSALFNTPIDVAVDRNGKVYISDSGNHRIRVIALETIGL